MPAMIAMTVGSAQGWAQPKRVLVDLDADLTISNVHEVSWPIAHPGRVDRAAAFWGGDWFELDFAAAEVCAGDELAVPAGHLRFTARLERCLLLDSPRQISRAPALLSEGHEHYRD